MNSTKSYRWYFENGCELVPLKRPGGHRKNYSLTLLDIQADFSDLFTEGKGSTSKATEKAGTDGEKSGGMFYKQRNETGYKDAMTIIREKYVAEVDQLWAFIEWYYNFEDEIKVQKNLIADISKIRKVPKLHVSTHVIEGAVNDINADENICILKYTTFSHFSNHYNKELVDLQKRSNVYNRCKYVYEVCDIADKSLLFANSPIIHTTVKNILSITKSGKKREDFNATAEEEEEQDNVREDEIWQVYISNKLQNINDQWLLICINDKLKEIIKKSGDIYFKIFNKYIKEYNEIVQGQEYNLEKNRGGIGGVGIGGVGIGGGRIGGGVGIGGVGSSVRFNLSYSSADSRSTTPLKNDPLNSTTRTHVTGYEKYKVNLIFSENEDINSVIYKMCIKLGRLNDVVLCTKHKSYNIMMNDIDGTLAICFKSFLSKYFPTSWIQNLSDNDTDITNTTNNSNMNYEKNLQDSKGIKCIKGSKEKNNDIGTDLQLKENENSLHINDKANEKNNCYYDKDEGEGEGEDDEDNLIKTISIMGLCKEKMLLFEKATIFSNIDLLYSYYLLVHTDALNAGFTEDVKNKQTVDATTTTTNTTTTNTIENNVSESEEIDDDGIIYLSRKALFENIQFSNEEISSYLLHLQKYSINNLLYIKKKGYRYVKNEIVYEFLIKLLEHISLDDELYEEQPVEKVAFENPLFTKYQEDLYKVQKKRYGITFHNIFKIVTDNINDFQLFQINRLPVEKYVVLQLCLKCCDLENKRFEYFNLYYNYYFFYEYLNKESSTLCFEDILDKYLSFLHNDQYIDKTIIYFNLFKLHKLAAVNILRTSGSVDVYSDKLFTFSIKLDTYVKYIDGIFKSFNSNLMDKIIQYFIKNYQFFLDYGYDRKEKKRKKEMNNTTCDNTASNNNNNIIINGNVIHNSNNNNNNDNNDHNKTGDDGDDIYLGMDKYRNRVFFRHNVILNVSNINHICNDEYMFQYFIVVKYYYKDNNFGILETKLKKFIKTTEEDFIVSHQKAIEFDIDKKLKTNWQKLRSNYCLNYKIFKYQTITFPQIRLNYNYNDLLNTVYSPLSIHFSIFHENVIYNKKQNSFELMPSFLLKDYLRSCLTTLYTLKKSYYAQELYPFLNPLLDNKDLIGTIAVPPLRHCRTKLIERENIKNVEFIEMGNIITSTLNNDMKLYKSTHVKTKKYVEKLCKLYNCNLPVNIFSH